MNSKMQDLNSVAAAYQPNTPTSTENFLIMNWYPKRIIGRFGYAGSLLELGIGHGYTAQYFAKSCDRYVIVDGASAVIDRFKAGHPDFTGKIVHDLFEAFHPGELFDVIVMGFVLEHVDDPDLLLRRYKDFIAPNGRLYVAVPNAKSLNRRFGLELGLINDIYDLNENDVALGHQRQYSLDTLRAALKGSGYRITHEEGIYLKPLPISVLRTLPDFEANLDAMMKVGVEFPDLCVGMLAEAQPA